MWIAAAGCGRAVGDGEPLTASAGASGASAGHSGSAGASGKPEAGGAGGSVAAGDGSAGAPAPVSPSCVAQTSPASCSEPCLLAYATRLACTGPAFDLQLAETGLLLEWKTQDPALSVEQTFDYSQPAARLVNEQSFGPDRWQRVLARDGARNLLIEANEGGFAVSPWPIAELPGAGLPLAARLEGDTLHLLTKQAASPFEAGEIRELSVERGSSAVLDRSVYPSAMFARFIAGGAANSLMLVQPSNAASAPPFRAEDAPFYLYPVDQTARAIANGEGIALATLYDGSVEVSDQDGM
ncbi:MAG TPA: hypothetical protein VGJ91_13905, partial [Polyangiaceae bacterium]